MFAGPGYGIERLPVQSVVSGPLERGFKLYAEESVLSMGPSGSWDSGLMDPGAVVFHAGQFHMFYDAVPSFPALIEVEYATSANGIHWILSTQDPLVSAFDDLQAEIWYSAFVIHDRTAYLYFEAGSRNTSTYLATWTE